MSRAKYYYRPGHPKANANGFVEESELGEWRAPRAVDAPIMAGRFYENTASPLDGTDIGSRQKHRDYMREKGLTTADDYVAGVSRDESGPKVHLGETWTKAEAERRRVRAGDFDHADRREAIGRAALNIHKQGTE